MATQVKFAITEQEIKNSGITFQRVGISNPQGDLTIRQNHIIWRPTNNRLSYRVSWDKFANFAIDNGNKIRLRATAVKAQKKLKPIPG